jgi:hypothetical protein
MEEDGMEEAWARRHTRTEFRQEVVVQRCLEHVVVFGRTILKWSLSK